MTEPTREALHAETIAVLDALAAARRREGIPDERNGYAHAAACVKRVPELEAEVERLRAENYRLRYEIGLVLDPVAKNVLFRDLAAFRAAQEGTDA